MSLCTARHGGTTPGGDTGPSTQGRTVSSCLYVQLDIGEVIHDHLLGLGQSLAVLLDIGEVEVNTSCSEDMTDEAV